MLSKPKNKSEAVRQNKDYIQQKIAEGRSANSVRKELIKKRLIPPMSRGHFNEVVSDLDIRKQSVSKYAQKTVGTDPIAVPNPASLVIDAAATTFEKTNLDNIHAIGNITDDRFTGGY